MSEARDWLRANGFSVGKRGRIRPELMTAFENRLSAATEQPQIVYKKRTEEMPEDNSKDVTDPSRRCLNPRHTCEGYLKGKLDKNWQLCANCHCCEATHTKGEKNEV